MKIFYLMSFLTDVPKSGQIDYDEKHLHLTLLPAFTVADDATTTLCDRFALLAQDLPALALTPQRRALMGPDLNWPAVIFNDDRVYHLKFLSAARQTGAKFFTPYVDEQFTAHVTHGNFTPIVLNSVSLIFHQDRLGNDVTCVNTWSLEGKLN